MEERGEESQHGVRDEGEMGIYQKRPFLYFFVSLSFLSFFLFPPSTSIRP